MDKKTVTKRKQTTSSCTKLVKESAECLKCSSKLKQAEDHFCKCKTGIVNIGNSCYISSIFQTIAELKLYSTLNTDSQLYTVFDQANRYSEDSISIELALEEIKNLWSHENLQEDAYEFFMTVLPLLDSWKFMYEYFSQRYCEICNYSHEAVICEDSCFNMTVDKSLQQQLDGTVDSIDEICDNCGKGFLMKLRTFFKEPEILMIRILRFQINAKTGKPSKIWNKVQLPEQVTVGSKVYKLNIVVLHKSKALNHGHYLVYIHTKKIIIDDEKVYYNKPLKLDCSYFYIAFYM
jgi:uncharacterized UBP type Zn finger protein